MFAGMARGWKNLACKAQSTENAAKTEFQFVRFEPKLQLGWMFFDISLLLASFIRLFVYSFILWLSSHFFFACPFLEVRPKPICSDLSLFSFFTLHRIKRCLASKHRFFYSTSFVGKTLLPKKTLLFDKKVDYHKSLATFIEDVDNVDHWEANQTGNYQ